jgi:hypothetical protein
MATIVPSLPNNLTNGTTADATQVMANFNAVVAAVNSNAANSGVNTNINQIVGLTSPLSVNQGGVGLTSIPANSVMIGEGTSNINVAAPGAAGQVLASNGPTSDPSFQGGFVPSGVGVWWPTSTPPANWVEAAGQSTSGMSTAIIALYGSNLPDMRGVFPRGWDHGRGLDPNAPSLLSYHGDQFASHTHTDAGHLHNMYHQQVRAGNTGNYWEALMNGLNASSGGSGTNPSAVDTGGIQTGNANIQATGGSETAPKYMPWMFIIKT